ncbi:hypothetical protein BH18GEM1_BH18GEM1_12620 [soil metagenome]
MFPDLTPEVPRSERILRNAYRVLGLPGEADWAAIRAAAEGERDTPWDLPWLGPLARTPTARSLALSRLTDAHQRLRERLFWFHEAAAEEAVADLEPGLLRNAMEGWASTSVVTARHDAALVALLAAITHDPLVKDGPLWSTALQRWRETLESEEYWLAVIQVEREGAFDVPAPFSDIYELRDSALRLVAEVPAGIAREAFLDGDEDSARRAIAVLKDALPEAAFSTLIGDLASQIDQASVPASAPATRAGPATAKAETLSPTEPVEKVFDGREETSLPEPTRMDAPQQGDAPAEQDVPTEALPVPMRRPRRKLAIALGALAIVALAIFALPPLRHRLPGGAATIAGRSRPSLATTERALEENDQPLAEALVERWNSEREIAQIGDAARDYQVLIDDYQRRIAYRLNVDLEAYERVVRLHAAAIQQHEAASDRHEALDRRVAQLREREAALIAEYNAGIHP